MHEVLSCLIALDNMCGSMKRKSNASVACLFLLVQLSTSSVLQPCVYDTGIGHKGTSNIGMYI